MKILFIVHAVGQHAHIITRDKALIALNGNQQILPARFFHLRGEIAQFNAQRREAGIQFRQIFNRHGKRLLLKMQCANYAV